MSDSSKIAGVPLGFVRGGTSTAAWDLEKKKQYATSDNNRSYQDQVRKAAAAAPAPGVAAGLHSYELMKKTNPKVVFEYVYRDSIHNRECLGELFTLPSEARPGEQQLAFILVCPICLQRTGRMDDSQCIVRQDHRNFWLDETKRRVWVNQVDGSVHTLAGNVTMDGKGKCDAAGCTWRFAIEDGKLREV